MSSFMDSYNYSLMAVPASWLVAMSAHFYAISLMGKQFHNSAPRQSLAAIQRIEKPSAVQRQIMRAEAANMNGFEGMGLFAAGVVAMNIAKLPASTANTLTFSYLASRVLFNLLYIFVESDSVANLRSIVYIGGIGLVSTMFIKAGMVMQNVW